MARIPLRSYHREIENLIDRGQIEEAIAHSKNILKQYPKHIETYRLLGKAFLESQRYSEASDILQRLLSVVPDDFVSQLGMSVIREDEGNLDAAIWHMERAYEVQPFNRAIQDELRRLYGRRDGSEPPRIRLTRGSLVRMYARGDLYSQAIAETRAALAEDHQRLDLLVLLAQMYYLSGQKNEAAEIASSLIGKLPYCLEANRILMDILPSTSRAEEARVFQHRVFDLDPYAEFVTPNTPTSTQVPEQAVMVERVDWQPTMQESQSPDWTRTIGVKWEAEKEENLPDWLNSFGTSPSPTTPSASVPVQPQEIIPDFMREAGWSQSDHPNEEPPPPMAVDEPAAATSEDDLEQVDIPDWLKEMAPKSIQTEAETEDKSTDWLESILPAAGAAGLAATGLEGESNQKPASDADLSNLPVHSSLDYQNIATLENKDSAPSQETQPVSDFEQSAPAAGTQNSEDEVPAWLKGFGETEEVSSKDESAAPGQTLTPTEGEPPAWLASEEPSGKDDFAWIQSDSATTTQASEDLPSWLNENVEEKTQPGDEILSWLEETPSAESVESDKLDQPDWMSQPLPTDSSTVPPLGEVSEDPLSSWLSDLKTPDAETPSFVEITTGPAQPDAIPDWLSLLEEPGPEMSSVPQEQSVPDPISEEIPAWISENPETLAPPSEQYPSQPEATTPNLQDMDLDSAMAWLEGLAAKQGAEEGSLKITSPDQRTETPPDWISGYTQSAQLEESQPPATAQEEENPGWMAESSPQASSENILESLPTIEKPAEENVLPSWSPPAMEEVPGEETHVSGDEPKGTTPESIFPIEAVDLPQEEKTQPLSVRKTAELSMAPEVSSELPAASGPGLDDMDAAMAWMEALAAKQGADADSLKITSLEDRSETPPDWIASLSPAEPEPESNPTPGSEPILTGDEPQIPDWMQAEAPVSQPVLTEPAVPADDIPDWLKGLDDEEETQEPILEPPQSSPAEMESILQGLAEPEQPSAALENASPITLPELPVEFETSLEDTAQIPTQEAAPETDDMESAMAWMEALASKQGAEADSLKISSPDQRSETPPDWITELAKDQPEPAVEQEAIISAETLLPVDELPAVLEVPLPQIPGQNPPEFVNQTPSQEPAETEIPFWLLNYEQEQNAKPWETTENVQPVPVQASAADDSITVWLKSHHPDTGELKPPSTGDDIPGQEEITPTPQPSVMESPLVEARTAISRGNTSEAIRYYSQMIKSGENLDIVVKDLREAVLRHPSDVDIWQTLGDAHIRANRVQEALDAYTQAEELLQ